MTDVCTVRSIAYVGMQLHNGKYGADVAGGGAKRAPCLYMGHSMSNQHAKWTLVIDFAKKLVSTYLTLSDELACNFSS